LAAEALAAPDPHVRQWVAAALAELIDGAGLDRQQLGDLLGAHQRLGEKVGLARFG
jgi:hypothetical protein